MVQAGDRARVLLVEDETLVAVLLADMLRDIGYAVVGPAARVAAALRLAETERLDAAVLDVNVAGEPVFPVAEALERRGVGFVFSTGYGARGVAPDFGSRPILQKPFDAADLRRALEHVMARGGVG